MKKQTVWIAALTAVLMSTVQIASAQNTMKKEPAPRMSEIQYQCNDGSMAHVVYSTENGRKVVKLNDMNSTYTLPVVPEKSGTRYSDTNVEWWIEGNEVTFNRNINDLKSLPTHCKVAK